MQASISYNLTSMPPCQVRLFNVRTPARTPLVLGGWSGLPEIPVKLLRCVFVTHGLRYSSSKSGSPSQSAFASVSASSCSTPPKSDSEACLVAQKGQTTIDPLYSIFTSALSGRRRLSCWLPPRLPPWACQLFSWVPSANYDCPPRPC